MAKLSLTAKERYIRAPLACPFCGSDDISFGEYIGDSNQVYIDVKCRRCEELWREVYTLMDVEET